LKIKKNNYISSIANTMGKPLNSQLLILASGRQGDTRFRLPSVSTSSIVATLTKEGPNKVQS